VNTAPENLDAELLKLKQEIDVANESTVCEKEELDIPVTGIPVRPLEITRMLLEDGWAKIKRLFSTNGKPTNGKHEGGDRQSHEVAADVERTTDV
jgi:hypothetical protein